MGEKHEKNFDPLTRPLAASLSICRLSPVTLGGGGGSSGGDHCAHHRCLLFCDLILGTCMPLSSVADACGPLLATNDEHLC